MMLEHKIEETRCKYSVLTNRPKFFPLIFAAADRIASYVFNT